MTPYTAAAVENIEWLIESREGLGRICQSLGVTERSLQRLLIRAGRYELWVRLNPGR